jgi:hypothetical protein
MKSKKYSTLLEKYRAIQAIGTTVPVPYDAWRMFGGNTKVISVVGEEVSFGEDYVSIELARQGLAWYVNQLGGTVVWNKN